MITSTAIGPLRFSRVSLKQAVDQVLRWSTEGHGRAIHFANAYTIALAGKDSEYASTINAGDLVCCDGTPVVWAGKWLDSGDNAHWERVYGPDVTTAVIAQSASEQKHYFLGSTPETLERLNSNIAKQFPHAVVVGFESPPFREPTTAELQERDQRIKESGANLVWIGLGTPKQDYEVARIKASIPVTALAVGAAFDFLAGTVAQAPVWMQRSGTEWIFRWSREPKRLTHRYLWGNPTFVKLVVQQRLADRGKSS